MACRAVSTPICASRRARSASTTHVGRKSPATYADVNEMFGDIVKVTPTSKVVGDMALLMVTNGLTRQAVLDPNTEIAFPESVVQLFRGDLGQPYGGFPPDLQRKVLQGTAPRKDRPGVESPPADLDKLRTEASERAARAVTDRQFASYLMYPKVFTDYAADRRRFSDVAILPTPVFFYGMEPGQEISVDLERGKTLIVRYVTRSEPHEDGTRTVFFELNGQPRSVRVTDRSQTPKRAPQRKLDPGQSASHWRADAGVGGHGQRRGRTEDQAWRSGRDDRSHEDGGSRACRGRGRGGGSAGTARHPDRCQGPAGGAALGRLA